MLEIFLYLLPLLILVPLFMWAASLPPSKDKALKAPMVGEKGSPANIAYRVFMLIIAFALMAFLVRYQYNNIESNDTLYKVFSVASFWFIVWGGIYITRKARERNKD